MTNDEKKSLYESIMREVAQQVKRHINEEVDWRPKGSSNLPIYDELRDPKDAQEYLSMMKKYLDSIYNWLSLVHNASCEKDSKTGEYEEISQKDREYIDNVTTYMIHLVQTCEQKTNFVISKIKK